MERRAELGGVAVGDGLPVAVIGVLNVSPESFYGGSVHLADLALLDAARAMVDAGAALIDIGARSTAPYLPATLDPAPETERLTRAVECLAGKLPVPISADTARPGPARAALEAGARVINDVSGLSDAGVARLVAEHQAGLIAVASPDRSGAAPGTSDPVETVTARLRRSLERAATAGVSEERIVVDPGIGFFRGEPVGWPEWDARVLAGLAALTPLGRPVAVGVSRKSFIGAFTGRADPRQRLAGSLAATAAAVLAGAAVIRTHDVGETLDAVRVAERLRRGPPW